MKLTEIKLYTINYLNNFWDSGSCVEQRCILWRKLEKEIKKELKYLDFDLFKNVFFTSFREKIPQYLLKNK